MVIGSVLNYSGEYGLRGSQVRAKYLGRGPFSNHGEIQPALKPATVLRQDPRSTSLPTGTNRDRSNYNPTRLTLGSQSHDSRRNPYLKSTLPGTAKVIMMSMHSSGESGIESLFTSPDPKCNKRNNMELISTYGGAPPTSTKRCQLESRQAGIHDRSLRCSAPIQKNKSNFSTPSERKTQSQPFHETTRKISSPPSSLGQKTQLSSIILDNSNEESHNRFDKCPRMAYRGIFGGQSIIQQEDRGPLDQPLSPRVAADLFWNSYDKHVSTNRPERQGESRNGKCRKYDSTRSIETTIVRRFDIPTASSQCARLPKSLHEHKKENITESEKKSFRCTGNKSAKAVFATQYGISKPFNEDDKRPPNYRLSSPSTENQSKMNTGRYPREEVKIAIQKRTSCNAVSSMKTCENRANHCFQMHHNKTCSNDNGSPEITGREVIQSPSTKNFTPKQYRPSQPASSQAEWNGWCESYIASKNIGMPILHSRKLTQRTMFDQVPKSSSEGLGESASSIKEELPQTRTEKSASLNHEKQITFLSHKKVHRCHETKRANKENHASPSMVTVVVTQERLAQGKPKHDYPSVAHVSRENGEVFRSGSHISASVRPRERTKNSQSIKIVSLPLENKEPPLHRYGSLSTDSGSSKKSWPQNEISSRSTKVGAGRAYSKSERISSENDQPHSERYQNLINISLKKNSKPLGDSNNGFTNLDTEDQASNLVGRVSRVVGYFENLTLSESSCKPKRTRYANSESLEVEHEKKKAGLFESCRLPKGVKYASCPEGTTRSFEYQSDCEKCTSLPLDWKGVEIQPMKYDKGPRKAKVLRKLHRSVSLMNKDSGQHGDGMSRSHNVKRSASFVSGSKTQRFAGTKGLSSDKEPDDVFLNINNSQGKNDDSATEDTQLALEIEETYLRRKLMSNSSDDSLDSDPCSPDTDYKFFRRAVYGSVFACEEAYTNLHSSPSTDESDDGPSPSPSYSSSLGGRSRSGMKSESESEKSTSSSDENTDCDSGVVDDSEEVKELPHTRPSLGITEMAQSMGSKRILWSHIPEIAKGEFFRSLTSNQLKLQETKFEVITTEAYYMECLCVVISHFYGSELFNDENVICKEDKDILFSNIMEVRRCSQRLLSDLKWCWEDDISLQDLDEIIYKHAVDNFGVYVTYCFNQIYQSNVLNKLMKSEDFLQALTELENHPMCERKTLPCYLIMPMQRVTRIRLLVDAILARLSPDNQKYNGWKMASEALNRVVRQCNKAAKHAAMQVRSHSIRKKLDFSGFKHENIHLGELQLVHHGQVLHLHSSNEPSDHLGALSSAAYRKIMKQPFTFGRKIKQPLHLYLFRDMLLITKKKSENTYMVLVYCPRSDVDVSNGDSYSLLEIPHKNISENWKNVFHLFMQQGCDKGVIEMILSASNEYEKNLWLDAFATRCSSMESLKCLGEV